ncbi:EAL domain-containing protein [Aquitalea magnusonii]|uniref:EAL domain-containing protein (Putative c-di-GMP-specific phosphodiesterase class I) n=1 Tax=Aquitalea magnusonii TaxID=332411 RepID=A0A318JRB5_9NEIS|nr:EAL domain-containing protein [Aquitalea magnusonii]PXX42848.1 EAL domain-containing protein (putative c-di-GMP-specific phosphodiesterase class I) [Aquitalea magnusonii]
MTPSQAAGFLAQTEHLTGHATSDSGGAMPIDEIWKALVNDQLVPYFQPIVDIRDRRVIGAEALARWRHPALGVLSPITFVPVMEERGMIRELTELILEKSLYACRDWLDQGQALQVSINLSAQLLADPQLAGHLAQKTRLAGLQPANLTLEFSESTLRQHWAMADTQLQALRQAGFGVMVDEFGIGTGLTDKLQSSHFSGLKIDRAFVHGAGDNQHLRAILGEALALAQAGGLSTVGMGVEDATDLSVLSELGCHAVQGYICAAPLPASGLIPWISQWEKR